MPYYKQTIDDKVVSKACAASLPLGEGWELIEGDPALVEVYQDPVVISDEEEVEAMIKDKMREIAKESLVAEGKIEVIEGEVHKKVTAK